MGIKDSNKQLQFQSPCGDQIFGNLKILNYNIIKISFSPLAGIRYSETHRFHRCYSLIQLVSVPLRGLDIRKPKKVWGLVADRSRFSPLAGIRYSETQVIYIEQKDKRWFQSPCGDQIFGNWRSHSIKSQVIYSFSPLAGIRYSETSWDFHPNHPQNFVSVPLRGLDIRKLSKEENDLRK